MFTSRYACMLYTYMSMFSALVDIGSLWVTVSISIRVIDMIVIKSALLYSAQTPPPPPSPVTKCKPDPSELCVGIW